MTRKRKLRPSKFQSMAEDTSPQLRSLGETSANEGQVLGRQTKAGMTIRYENAACSCGGENANCFKCDGTGYYRREIVETIDFDPTGKIAKFRSEIVSRPKPEAHFSNDTRGGEYGLRERGRFASSPLHDDYDN